MSLIVKIGADTRKFDKEMRKLTKDINQVSNKLGDIGRTMTTTVTAPLAGVGVIAAKTGMEFEAGMSKVAATLGTTTDKISDLEDLAKEMGSTTRFSATEAAEGINYMAMAGWKSEQIMKGLPAVLNLAAAGGMELGEASDIVTDAMTGMGIGADGAEAFVDLMAKTASNANTSVRDMGSAMILTAGQANSLAIEQKDLALAIGLMANAGFKGEIAGQHLSSGIRQLVNPTKKQKEYMEKYGIAMQKNADGGLDLGATMEHLRDKLTGLDRVTQAQVMSVLLGADAQKSWSAIINSSETDFNNLKDAISNSEGAGKQMAETMGNNLSGRITEMKSALEGVAIQIYDYLKPALEQIVSWITKAAQAFGNLSPKTQAFIVSLAALLASVGPLLVAFSTILKMIGFVKGAFTALGVASMGAVGIWVAVGVAVAALVMAIIFYWDEIVAATKAAWEWIKDFLSALWDGIVSVAKAVWEPISEFFSGLWEGIKSVTETVWNGIKDFFSEWGLTILAVITGPIGWLVGLIVKYWDEIKAVTTIVWVAIKSFLGSIWNGIVAIFSPIFNGIVTVIQTVWNTVKTVTSAVWNFIKQYLIALWNALMYFVKPVFDSMMNSIKSAWETVKNVSSNIWNGIKNFLSSIWNGIKSVATTVWNAIKSFFTSWLNQTKSNMSSVWNTIKSVVSNVWNSIKSVATTVWNAIKNAVMGPINTLKSMATNAFNSLKSSVSSIFNSIKSVALSIWNSVYSSVTSKVNALVNGVKGAFNGLKSAVVGIWNGIKSAIKSVVNGIISMINKFIGGFNKPAELLNKIPGVNAPKIPKIPMLATGGTIFGSGAAIVGEAGPELISKSGSQVKVTPLSAQEKARGISGAIGGGGTSITIQSLVVREEADIEKIARELNRVQERAQRASGRLSF
jgi:TP901 family phage tail tape measure protein